MTDIIFSTATALAGAIRRKKVSAVEVLDAHLAHIAKHNPKLNAIVTLDKKGARKRAKEADGRLKRGEVWGPLHGVPVTLKDAHSVKGVRSTSGGFPEYAERVPIEDGAIPAKLRQAGAIIIGLTNVHAVERNIFGRTNNPWDLERSPNGSSAGSAAAVAAGLIPFDIGTDSLGSIIDPAAFCGVFGMRPTEHRVSNAGYKVYGTPHTWLPFTVQGPLTRSVEDLELALKVIAGPDGRDPDVPPLPWRSCPKVKWKDLRIAWAYTFPGMTVASDIRRAVESLAVALERKGVHTEQTVPKLDYVAEHKLGWQFMPYSWDELFRANGWISADTPPTTLSEFREAIYQREQFTRIWEQFFVQWDVLLCPATPTAATRHDEPELIIDGQKVPADESHSISGSISPLTGLPSVVMPVGLDSQGLPIGIQLIGRRWEDERLLAIASSVAEITGGFHRPSGY